MQCRTPNGKISDTKKALNTQGILKFPAASNNCSSQCLPLCHKKCCCGGESSHEMLDESLHEVLACIAHSSSASLCVASSGEAF